MDVQMPKMDGLEATRRLARDAGVGSRVVILTTFEQDDYVFEALRAGASGFLLKNAPPGGSRCTPSASSPPATRCCPSVTRRVSRSTRGVRRGRARCGARAADGARGRGAAPARDRHEQRRARPQLYLGEGTIKTHVSHVLAKLGLRDRVQAVVFAYENGLVEPRER